MNGGENGVRLEEMKVEKGSFRKNGKMGNGRRRKVMKECQYVYVDKYSM